IIFTINYLKNKKVKDPVVYDFTTKYGTKVKLSELSNDLKPEIIEEWTDYVVDVWHKAKNWDKEESYKEIGKLCVHMCDEFRLERSWATAEGFLILKNLVIEISTISDSGDYSLEEIAIIFKHEVSHLLAYRIGNMYGDYEEHHKLFSNLGL
ncbi:MAG: hypothetical protein ACXACY_29360, partial [Candidatus Hodarchaeales archaeon]